MSRDALARCITCGWTGIYKLEPMRAAMDRVAAALAALRAP